MAAAKSLERAQKIERCAALRAQGKTALEIAKLLKLPDGTVKNYIHEVRRQERELAESMDPKELAEKKAEIIQGLEHDLKEAYELYETIKVGQKTPVIVNGSAMKNSKGHIVYKYQRNEMACVSCLKHITEIRCKLAGFYGLNQIEMTVTNKLVAEIRVISALGAPSALKPVIDVTPKAKALSGNSPA